MFPAGAGVILDGVFVQLLYSGVSRRRGGDPILFADFGFGN